MGTWKVDRVSSSGKGLRDSCTGAAVGEKRANKRRMGVSVSVAVDNVFGFLLMSYKIFE